MSATNTIAILGARGRAGGAVTEAFLRAGWSVRAIVRPGSGGELPNGVEARQADAEQPAQLAEALAGAQVLFNGVNPPYWAWAKRALPMARSVVEAAIAAKVETQLFPGNVYGYGPELPTRIDPSTPAAPGRVRKGRIRAEMEALFEDASSQLQTLVLRAGDFYGYGLGSWMDLTIAKRLKQGIFTYPGPMDRPHAWAYLPDLAVAFVAMAERRGQLPPYRALLFAGHTLTGEELHAGLTKAVGEPLRTTALPWFWLRLGSFISPMLREVCEMAYLWERPHELFDPEVAGWELPETPVAYALDAAVRDLLSGEDQLAAAA